MIGNDVWIGYEAVILAGVHIGDGAIIGARAVVTKDVAPYTIVGGVPAKEIHKRFDEKTITQLREISWWDWPFAKIQQALPLIQSGDVEGLSGLAKKIASDSSFRTQPFKNKGGFMEKSMIAQRIATFKDFGETFKGAKVYFRDDWAVFYFDLQGKMFGMMSDQAGEDAIITLKNLPEKNEELRELYQGIVIPGYYANKTHWNSIKLASPEVSDEAIKQMITISYQLVYQKLTKKQKAEIDGE